MRQLFCIGTAHNLSGGTDYTERWYTFDGQHVHHKGQIIGPAHDKASAEDVAREYQEADLIAAHNKQLPQPA